MIQNVNKIAGMKDKLTGEFEAFTDDNIKSVKYHNDGSVSIRFNFDGN